MGKKVESYRERRPKRGGSPCDAPALPRLPVPVGGHSLPAGPGSVCGSSDSSQTSVWQTVMRCAGCVCPTTEEVAGESQDPASPAPPYTPLPHPKKKEKGRKKKIHSSFLSFKAEQRGDPDGASSLLGLRFSLLLLNNQWNK